MQIQTNPMEKDRKTQQDKVASLKALGLALVSKQFPQLLVSSADGDRKRWVSDCRMVLRPEKSSDGSRGKSVIPKGIKQSIDLCKTVRRESGEFEFQVIVQSVGSHFHCGVLNDFKLLENSLGLTKEGFVSWNEDQARKPLDAIIFISECLEVHYIVQSRTLLDHIISEHVTLGHADKIFALVQDPRQIVLDGDFVSVSIAGLDPESSSLHEFRRVVTREVDDFRKALGKVLPSGQAGLAVWANLEGSSYTDISSGMPSEEDFAAHLARLNTFRYPVVGFVELLWKHLGVEDHFSIAHPFKFLRPQWNKKEDLSPRSAAAAAGAGAEPGVADAVAESAVVSSSEVFKENFFLLDAKTATVSHRALIYSRLLDFVRSGDLGRLDFHVAAVKEKWLSLYREQLLALPVQLRAEYQEAIEREVAPEGAPSAESTERVYSCKAHATFSFVKYLEWALVDKLVTFRERIGDRSRSLLELCPAIVDDLITTLGLPSEKKARGLSSSAAAVLAVEAAVEAAVAELPADISAIRIDTKGKGRDAGAGSQASTASGGVGGGGKKANQKAGAAAGGAAGEAADGRQRGKSAENRAQVFAEASLSSSPRYSTATHTVSTNISVSFDLQNVPCKGELDVCVTNIEDSTLCEILESKCSKKSLFVDLTRSLRLIDGFLRPSAFDLCALKLRKRCLEDPSSALFNMPDEMVMFRLQQLWAAVGKERAEAVAEGAMVEGVNLADNSHSHCAAVGWEECVRSVESLPRSSSQKPWHVGDKKKNGQRSLRLCEDFRLHYLIGAEAAKPEKAGAGGGGAKKRPEPTLSSELFNSLKQMAFGQLLHAVCVDMIRRQRTSDLAPASDSAGAPTAAPRCEWPASTVSISADPSKPQTVQILFSEANPIFAAVWGSFHLLVDRFEKEFRSGRFAISVENESGEFERATEVDFGLRESPPNRFFYPMDGFVGNIWKGLCEDEGFSKVEEIVTTWPKKLPKMTVPSKVSLFVYVCAETEAAKAAAILSKFATDVCPNFDLAKLDGDGEALAGHREELRLSSVTGKRFHEQFDAACALVGLMRRLRAGYPGLLPPFFADLA